MIEFGTGGFRAIIGEKFTKQNIIKIGSALAKLIEEHQLSNTVIIGYDRRFLSKEAAIWLSECLAFHFIDVQFVNKSSPTPLIMHAVKEAGIDFGLMITASHNPAIYNGIKVFTTGGQDASQWWTDQIQKNANDSSSNLIHELSFEAYVKSGRIQYILPMNAYLDSILELINVESIRNAHLKVALDPMFGVGQTSLQTILLTARCNVGIINQRHDTLFGGKLPAPTPHTIIPLQNFVVDNGYDIGIATDGDADRIGIIDDKGRFLTPNDILVLLYYYLLKYKNMRGPIVRNVSTTHRLDRVADYFGETCYEVPVGFKNVSHMMIETNALVGGESSGGLSVRGHINGKDGIYAGALLVEMIAEVKQPLSSFYESCEDLFGTTATLELEFKLSNNDKDSVETLIRQFDLKQSGLPFDSINDLDGLKLIFESGWILLRFSGTEPLLRLAGEAESESMLLERAQLIKTYFNL